MSPAAGGVLAVPARTPGRPTPELDRVCPQELTVSATRSIGFSLCLAISSPPVCVVLLTSWAHHAQVPWHGAVRRL